MSGTNPWTASRQRLPAPPRSRSSGARRSSPRSSSSPASPKRSSSAGWPWRSPARAGRAAAPTTRSPMPSTRSTPAPQATASRSPSARSSPRSCATTSTWRRSKPPSRATAWPACLPISVSPRASSPPRLRRRRPHGRTVSRSSSTSTSARRRSPRGCGSSSMPSVAEIRAVGQPESLHVASGYEHWAGRLYMRRVSPYVTRALVATPISANAVTALLLPAGLLAALSLTVTGIWGAVGAVLFAQLWLLLDCCDGAVARWRRTFSAKGVYLDGLSHSLTQAALPAGLGIRADGGWDSIGGWTALGLLASLLVLAVSLESHLVHSVR